MSVAKKDQGIVEGCKGCLKQVGKFCKVILEPSYFFKSYGECFARTEDQQEIDNIRQATEAYVKDKSGKSTGVRGGNA